MRRTIKIMPIASAGAPKRQTTTTIVEGNKVDTFVRRERRGSSHDVKTKCNAFD
jgi:hypothetical protein